MNQGDGPDTELGLYQQHALREHVDCGILDMEPEFQEIFHACKDATMTSDARMYAMYNATRHIVEADVAGDIVECGVWRGGSVMISALTLRKLDQTRRNLYLCDTYAGLPEPEDIDRDLRGVPAFEMWKSYQDDGTDTLANSPLTEVRRNLESTGYPTEQIHYVVGMVEDTLPESSPKEIALLRIDTDWYSSIAHTLETLWPRVSRGGIVIIDDYGHFEGARKAVDEFLAGLDQKLLMHRIDYTGRLLQKP